MVKEALDMFMAGEAWEKARDIARNIAPRLGEAPLYHDSDCHTSLAA